MDNLNKGKLLSIIIPVYNTSIEKLSGCLNSLIKSYTDFIEVIVVNDGSTKENTLLYNKLFSNYNFLSVYYQENQGVSQARNLGIEKAKGKYVFFLDSDDILKFDLNKIIDILKNDDNTKLYVFNFLVNDNILCNNTKIDNIFDLVTNGLLNPLWNKIYLKNQIKILLNSKLSLGEDLIFNYEYIINCENFNFLFYKDIYSINYLVDDNMSLTKKYNGDECIFYQEQIKCLKQLYDKKIITKNQLNIMLCNAARSLIGISSRIFNLKQYSLKEKKRKYRNNKKLIFKNIKISNIKTMKDFIYFIALIFKIDEIKYIKKARKNKNEQTN